MRLNDKTGQDYFGACRSCHRAYDAANRSIWAAVKTAVLSQAA